MKVYIASNSSRSTGTPVYHTDKECNKLVRSRDYRTKQLEHIEAHRDICKECAGEKRYSNGNPKDRQRELFANIVDEETLEEIL